MKKLSVVALLLAAATLSLEAQNATTASSNREPSLHITSRAVLVDVIVTGKDGNPVTGLPQSAFTITDNGKPQKINFFEENGTHPAPAAEMPKLPPDVFSNFSPFPQPPAVNVIVMDSLNTAMTFQVHIHSQVKKFLAQAKPGTRSAIFTMGLNLRLIQGFTDDPAVLLAALENKKNIEIETPAAMKLQAEQKAEAALMGISSPEMAASQQQFNAAMDSFRTNDRMLRTLSNLQRLADFLAGIPGRKNIIWFAQKVPAAFVVEGGVMQSSNPLVDDEIKKTLAILADERAAIYPVSPRALQAPGLVLDTVDSGQTGGPSDRNSDILNAEVLAEASGGRAFANTNGIAEVMQKVTSDGNHFYTLSYTPNAKMDGAWRKIGVKVEGGKYQLSYRRGYFAVETPSPGDKKQKGKPTPHTLLAEYPELKHGISAQMILGMPQSEQILYNVRVVPSTPAENVSIESKKQDHYKIDFAVDLNDLKLKSGSGNVRTGKVIVSLLVYDRYGHLVSHEDHDAALHVTPDAYALYQSSGVQLHADVATPKGNYWLRTAIYDPNSHKVGTLEVPLAAVKPLETAHVAAP